MPDPDLIKDILRQLLEAVGKVERRSAGIGSANDFVTSEEGIDRLDAICMMLIAIGESCKHLDKITDGNIFIRYPSIDWKGVKGIRDIMSHHYFDMNEPRSKLRGIGTKHRGSFVLQGMGLYACPYPVVPFSR